MLKKYFEDDSYNIMPCVVVAFQNDSTLKIISANDYYYSTYANGNFETGKDKSKGHGYGTKSIARVIQKYNGEADMRYDEETKEFHSIIRFPVHS